jgi:phenylpropionate dioxygenase-like ring-hydroxylating dioxygenase large terminal subunit
MDQATQIDLTRQILTHLDAGTTATVDEVMRNPITNFTCPDRLAREQEILFRKHPLMLALSGDLAAPGDYITNDHLGVPILMVRGDDGEVRAFLNVCRHRGARMLEGRGKAGRVMVCPYHAWSYTRDGNLAKLPHKESFPGVEQSQCGLRQLPCVERDGMVWVNATLGEDFDPDQALAGMNVDLASFDLGGQVPYLHKELTVKMNWKIVIDTFLEPYHLSSLHRDTVGPIFFNNLCLIDEYGPNLRETIVRKSITELRELPEDQWDLIRHSALLYVLFPNTILIMQVDHVEIWRAYPMPGKVDEAIVEFDFYIPEAATSDKAKLHWEKNADLAFRTVLTEDFPAGEGIQAGFLSGAQDHVTYGVNEPGLAIWEANVTKAVSAA